jgi:ribonuclease HI
LEHFISPWIQQGRSLCEVIHNICSSNDKDVAGLFATLIWVVWNNRNNCVWNDTKESGRNLGHKARQLWEEWFSAQQIQAGQQVIMQQNQVVRWQKPPEGWYKCNVDAGFHRDKYRTSGGWCLRDHVGGFVAAGTSWMEGNCSVIEGESIVLLDTLRELEQRGISHVVVETDSKSLVDAIHHLHVGSSEFSLLVCQIKNVLFANPNFMVRFVKRQANIVAHTLAMAAISRPRRCTFDRLPTCIAQLLNNEMI